MHKKYRAVFVDLDGTLLAPGAKVSPRTVACIQALKQKGIPVIIATGRPIESVRTLLGNIHDQDPVITLSGSMIHHSLFGEALYARTIAFETVHSLLESCRSLDGVENVLLDESEGFYALHDNPELDEFVGMYRKKPQMFTYDTIPVGPVLSILVHAKESRRSVYTQLQEQFGESLHFTYFREYPWIELSHLNSNKGTALEIVCEHLGISPEEVVALGDGANDLEMIARAGLGVAMSNADEEVKAIADEVAPHHAADGVAQFLEAMFQLESMAGA